MAWILGENGNCIVFSWIDESFISSNLGEMRDGGKMLKEKKNDYDANKSSWKIRKMEMAWILIENEDDADVSWNSRMFGLR